MYFERARGCRLWDMDGNEYVDYLMAYGAVILGYAEPAVDAAAAEQAARGNLVSLNHPIHVAFIEALLGRFGAAEMGVFCKSGSEATTAALRIARAFTKRRAVARCGYHGWHDWCVGDDSSVPSFGDQVLGYDARAPASLKSSFERHPGEIAAVICAPEMIWPAERDTLAELISITHAHGALFVLDEVKTAFRTRRGSIQQLFDLRPDLTTVSKALGNGWPIAAVIGRRDVMNAARGLHLSATYHGETAAMAAALKTMALVDEWEVEEHVNAMGERFLEGLNEAAAQHRLPAVAYGEPIPSMPFFRFDSGRPETDAALSDTFFAEAIAGGVLLHPRHLWFISYAHRKSDIDATLAVLGRAMSVTRSRHGGVL